MTASHAPERYPHLPGRFGGSSTPGVYRSGQGVAPACDVLGDAGPVLPLWDDEPHRRVAHWTAPDGLQVHSQWVEDAAGAHVQQRLSYDHLGAWVLVGAGVMSVQGGAAGCVAAQPLDIGALWACWGAAVGVPGTRAALAAAHRAASRPVVVDGVPSVPHLPLRLPLPGCLHRTFSDGSLGWWRGGAAPAGDVGFPTTTLPAPGDVAMAEFPHSGLWVRTQRDLDGACSQLVGVRGGESAAELRGGRVRVLAGGRGAGDALQVAFRAGRFVPHGRTRPWYPLGDGRAALELLIHERLDRWSDRPGVPEDDGYRAWWGLHEAQGTPLSTVGDLVDALRALGPKPTW